MTDQATLLLLETAETFNLNLADVLSLCAMIIGFFFWIHKVYVTEKGREDRRGMLSCVSAACLAALSGTSFVFWFALTSAVKVHPDLFSTASSMFNIAILSLVFSGAIMLYRSLTCAKISDTGQKTIDQEAEML